ncbi:PREDICTED: RING finger protein 141-like isoform X2 [Nicrophorus vespilloides]|uniref:RING finger protein 141 n=1 Tax=Nicrophorus vespilloides TaxID=110193 RepID=A0ABM1M0F6_NICVS|nr:PREDICTED: RING finger protein 141-like isoform X2 [Nicrophorus vespilloides]
MGQQQTSLQDFVSSNWSKLAAEGGNVAACPGLVSEEIFNMTYEEFITRMSELNKLSKECLDITGKQLLFAVKKGTESTFLWKATVQIACVKVEPISNKVHTYRLLSLREFLQVFHTLQMQHAVAEQSKVKISVSKFYDNIDDISSAEKQNECCICLERKTDILLPCAHTYCKQCIEEWNEDHRTCPICREKLQSTDDTWVLSEVPKADEISEEIRTTLMDLAGTSSK